MKKPWTLGEHLEQFEREEWGTNDFQEIKEKIREREWSDAQGRLTGMDEEQADWEDDEEDDSSNPQHGFDAYGVSGYEL